MSSGIIALQGGEDVKDPEEHTMGLRPFLVQTINQLTEEAHSHGGSSLMERYLELLTDPAHILFELTVTIIFDFFVVFVGYKFFLKKIILPRLRRDIHRELDEEHHVEHHEHLPGETAQECDARTALEGKTRA